MNTGMWVFVLLECAVVSGALACFRMDVSRPPDEKGRNWALWGAELAIFGTVICVIGFLVSMGGQLL